MNSHLEEALFALALRKPAAERAAFLERECGEDAGLRRRVEELLAAHESPDPFLEAQTAPSGITTVLGPLEEGPGTVIGRYKLLEQIGEGGFGVVYVAEQNEPVRRQVALKIIKLGMDTRQVVARFEAERQALALMDHPNIAKVFDAGATDSGRPFFVMELVKGIPITQYCDQEKLGTRNRLDLFIGVCQAIQHAHQKGIIHRDIKPSNILVTVPEGKPVPKVIDFGIAKATQQRLTEKTLHTQLEQFIGTPAYMSPEQAEMSGLDIDTRSDIYSLGVLLYELLVGKTPFDSMELLTAGLDEVRRTIREKDPVRPSTRLSLMEREELTTTTQRRGSEAPKLISLVRGDLDWIVMKCLEKDRTRRYETANGVAMDIQRHLNNEPVVARPPSKLYEFQKTVRRHKFGFAVAAALVTVLAFGVVVSTWQAVRATRAEREQNISREKAVKAEAVAKAQAKRAEQERNAAGRNAYAASMLLAQADWNNLNFDHLHQVLTETREYPHRGFEWFYWQRQTHLAFKTLRGHFKSVDSVAFSPDGRQIVTGSEDHTAKVWEAASGANLLTLKGHSDEVNSVAFSPDGQRIVTGSVDQTVKVWDATSGREVLTFKGHVAPIISVAFSPDSQRIVSGGHDLMAKVWDVASGREVLSVRHRGWIWSVAFSPDGQRIVTGSWDRTAKVWDATSGKELLTLKGHIGQVNSVAFSPVGQRIVTGSWDKTAKVWESVSGKEVLVLKGHKDLIWSVAFSPDGVRIVTGSGDQTAKIWEAASGKELLTLEGHVAPIMSVGFSADGQRLVTGSLDQTAKVWDAASGRELLTLKGHVAPIMSVAFSPDSQRIVTGSWDQTAKVWEAAHAEQITAWQAEEDAAQQSLAALRREQATEEERRRKALARDEGAIKRWLILAPIPLEPGQSGAEGLETEQIQGEARLRPIAGEARFSGRREFKWQAATSEDYVIDFNAILGRETTNSVAYAVCYLRSKTEQRGLRVLVGSDDQAKVYLNGAQIYKHGPDGRAFVADQDTASDITLNAGVNVVVVKVVNETLAWEGSIRFTDTQGKPVQGIKVTLDPEAKD